MRIVMLDREGMYEPDRVHDCKGDNFSVNNDMVEKS